MSVMIDKRQFASTTQGLKPASMKRLYVLLRGVATRANAIDATDQEAVDTFVAGETVIQLYADPELTTPISQPVFSDSQGRYEYFLPGTIPVDLYSPDDPDHPLQPWEAMSADELIEEVKVERWAGARVGDDWTDPIRFAVAEAHKILVAAGGTGGMPLTYPRLKFPQGDILYDGSEPITAFSEETDEHGFHLKGPGIGQGRLRLGDNCPTLMARTKRCWHGLVEDLTIQGGEVVFDSSFRDTNTGNWPIQFHRVSFFDHATCAIAEESPNIPFYDYDLVFFRGQPGAMDIAMSDTGGWTHFRGVVTKTRGTPQIKIANGGTGAQFESCVFLKANGADPATEMISIWVVPSLNSVRAGQGFTIYGGTKFGNEGLDDPSDRRIVYADDDAPVRTGAGTGPDPYVEMDGTGGNPLNRIYDGHAILDTASEAFIAGHDISEDTRVSGNNDSGRIPFVFTTAAVLDSSYRFTFDGTSPSLGLEYLEPPGIADTHQALTNLYGPFKGRKTDDNPPFRATNAPWTGRIIDPMGIASQNESTPFFTPGGGDKAIEITALPGVRSFSANAHATKNNKDANNGGTNAVELVGDASTDKDNPAILTGNFSDAEVSLLRPHWVECYLRRADADPVDSVKITLTNDASSVINRWTVSVPVNDEWAKYRYPWIPSEDPGANYKLQFAVLEEGAVEIGRARIYQGREPAPIITAEEAAEQWDLLMPVGGRVGTAATTAKIYLLIPGSSDLEQASGPVLANAAALAQVWKVYWDPSLFDLGDHTLHRWRLYANGGCSTDPNVDIVIGVYPVAISASTGRWETGTLVPNSQVTLPNPSGGNRRLPDTGPDFVDFDAPTAAGDYAACVSSVSGTPAAAVPISGRLMKSRAPE